MADEGNDLVSEAIDALQESRATSASPAASEGAQPVQEQKPTEATQAVDPAAQAEQVRKEIEERVRREEQSKRDRMLHQVQMQYEAEIQKRAEELARQQAQAAAIAQMDDEEFGRFTKKQLAEQAQAAQIEAQKRAAAEEVSRQEVLRERQRVLARIPQEHMDEFIKQEVEKVHNFDEFKDFAVDFLADIKSQSIAKKALEAHAKAEQNNNLAQQAAIAAPVVTTGSYSPSTKLSTDDLLTQGIEEGLEKSRKR